jgi:hypothetical protein
MPRRLLATFDGNRNRQEFDKTEGGTCFPFGWIVELRVWVQPIAVTNLDRVCSPSRPFRCVLGRFGTPSSNVMNSCPLSSSRCPVLPSKQGQVPDGDRRCGSLPGEDPGSRGGQRWPAGSLHLGDPAAVGTAHEELGRTFAGALPAGYLDGRLPGGASGTPGRGCAESFSGGDLQTDGGVAGRVRRWQKRDLSARRYVYVWADGVFLRLAWKTTANACWC